MPVEIPRLPLQVCFFAATNQEAAGLVTTLEAMLAGDAPDDAVALTRPGVPTRVFWTPEAVPWDEAAVTMVVLVVDDFLVGSTPWRAWVKAQMAEQDGQARRMLLVTLSRRFENLEIGDLQVIRLHELPEDRRASEAPARVFHALWRTLKGREAGQLFISHAKADGRALAQQITDYIQKSTTIRPLFDEVLLLEGEKFEPQLQQSLQTACALLVIVTDAWSGRYWCQRELLMAKAAGVPVVVLDVVHSQVPRQFPYLGNGATLRWAEGLEPTLIGKVMLEALRDAFVDRHLAVLAEAGWLPRKAGTLDRPPELATLARWRAHRMLVHPDPPLALHELDLLAEAAPTVCVRTPTQALMRRTEHTQPLTGHRIALSVSDPPHEERTRLGFTSKHIRRAWIALTRHLLAAGAQLDYGGDLRQGGYSQVLIELVRAHRQAQEAMQNEAVHMHLPWPQSLRFTHEDRADLPPAIDLTLYDMPADVPLNSGTWIDPTTVEGRFAWARSLTEMRVTMTTHTDARVLLGGQWTALGRIPGLAEEALLHLEAGKPVYLLGGFGGMTAAIAAAVRGEHPEQLTAEFQHKDELPAQAAEHYNRWVDSQPTDPSISSTARMRVDYDDLRARFARTGLRGLNNGLTPALNRRLMATRDLTEAIGLVLYGLQRRWAASGPPHVG